METINRDIVAAMLISKDNKLFVAMKNPKRLGVYSDCWHIPGGGINKNEEKIQALIREIKEETKIDISKYKIELVDDEGVGESERLLDHKQVHCKMRFFVYKVSIDDKNANEIIVNLDEELEKYEWVEFSELKKYKLTPPSVILFKKFGYL